MGEWTKEPPKVPGWYWRRKWLGPRDFKHECVRIDWIEYQETEYRAGGRVLHAKGDPIRDSRGSKTKWPLVAVHSKPLIEWWPIPITPPQPGDERE